jgi:hypothetical protein
MISDFIEENPVLKFGWYKLSVEIQPHMDLFFFLKNKQQNYNKKKVFIRKSLQLIPTKKI